MCQPQQRLYFLNANPISCGPANPVPASRAGRKRERMCVLTHTSAPHLSRTPSLNTAIVVLRRLSKGASKRAKISTYSCNRMAGITAIVATVKVGIARLQAP